MQADGAEFAIDRLHASGFFTGLCLRKPGSRYKVHHYDKGCLRERSSPYVGSNYLSASCIPWAEFARGSGEPTMA